VTQDFESDPLIDRRPQTAVLTVSIASGVNPHTEQCGKQWTGDRPALRLPGKQSGISTGHSMRPAPCVGRPSEMTTL